MESDKETEVPPAPRRWSRQPRSRPLHVAIITLVLWLVALTALGIGFSNYLNTRFAVTRFTDDLLGQIALQTREKVNDFLEPAAPSLALNHSLFLAEPGRYGILSDRQPVPPELRARADLFLRVLRAHPQFTRVHYGDRFRYFVAAHRHPTEGYRVVMRWPGATRTNHAVYRVNVQDEWIPTREADEDYDPTSRVWYRAAQQQKRLIWTNPYLFHEGHRPGMTAALPLYDRKNRLCGVFGIDFALEELDIFTAALSVDGRRVYLMATDPNSEDDLGRKSGAGGRRDPLIVAQPDPTQSLAPPQRVPSGAIIPLPYARESHEPLLQSIARAFPLLKPSGNQPIAPSVLNFQSGKTRYLGAVYPITVGTDLHWSVVIVTPEQKVLGLVNQNTTITILICLSLLIVACIAAVIFSVHIARPLHAFASEMERVGRFDIPEIAVPGSVIAEVDNMAEELEKMKASLRSFGKYVSSDMVRLLLMSGQEAKLGGQTTHITVFFADIVGFSTISEQMSPAALVDSMAIYLSEMEAIVRRHNGLVDKYSGDAVMAFWGAPIRPTESPEREACLAALEHVERFRTLREQCQAEGRTFFDAGIGVHTGDALVGNIGSEEKMNYTAMGDTVNLTSRLEGLNRIYGTRILLTEATYIVIRNEFETRLIDSVVVKGRRHATQVYELMGLRGQIDEAAQRLREKYTEGLQRYRARDWDGAIRAFQEGLTFVPEDGASLCLIERCQLYRQSPPPETWQGEYRMAAK